MTILLATQSNMRSLPGADGVGAFIYEQALGLFDVSGVAGFPGPTKIVGDLEKRRKDVAELLTTLAGKAQAEQFDPNYVGSGKKTVVGTNVPLGDGNISPLEEASIRQVFSQTPQASVLIKKRAFASLNHLYDPTLMDGAEKWLFRATKRLFMRKCAEIRDYEMLTKVKKLDEIGATSSTALLSLISNLGKQWKIFDSQVLENAQQQQSITRRSSDSGSNFFTSAFQLEKLSRAREPVDLTTWFYEPDLPIVEELGIGSGVFETTMVTSANTNLGIDGSGNCSFSLQNPYNIMMISENDIEMALRETSLSSLSSAVSSAAGLALSSAQSKDESLQQRRTARGRSTITFTVNIGGEEGATAIIDAIGYRITEDNLDLVPEGHDLDDAEKQLFKVVMKGLETYSAALRRDFMSGHPSGGSEKGSQFKNDMRYARSMMRKFYLGRLMIQPMDQVHVFIDGGTRRPGEGDRLGNEDFNESSFWNRDPYGIGDATTRTIGNIMGLQDSRQIDPALLREAWKQHGKHLKFEDFRKLYTMTEGGTHVFAGLVSNVGGQYSAESGTHTVNVSARSLIEWLSISRYNKQPALKQTDGIIFDPLTPFKFKTDEATGLPIGRPVLTDENKRILGGICAQYQPGGKKAGKIVRSELDLETDFKVIGGSLYPLFDMPHGLRYRWKEGIVTATYDMSTGDPLDKNRVNERQLRRDVGQFTSNTPFATMDVANIVSTLVTGYPYNPATFVASALNTGTFSLDTTLNSGLDYFHSLLDIQKSINLTQGNWTPFKRMSMDPKDLAQTLSLQQRLTKRSTEMAQLRSQLAGIDDNILRNEAAKKDNAILSSDHMVTLDALTRQRSRLEDKLDGIEDEFMKELSGKASDGVTAKVSAKDLSIKVAGNDVMFDLSNPRDDQDIMLLGDELVFVTQRRREDVIFNKDKNLFIVSDEYDKDFDIQVFNIQMAGGGFNMWKSTWEDVLGLCKRAAEIIDFEFFCMAENTPLIVKREGRILPTMIQDVDLDDSVLSINTESREISWSPCRPMRRKLRQDESMFRIKLGSGFSIMLSENHRLFLDDFSEILVKNIKPGMRLAIAEKLPNEERRPILSIADIFSDDPSFINHGGSFSLAKHGSRYRRIPSYMDFDEDMSWFFGLYAAKGSMSMPKNRKNKNNRGYHIILSLNYTEEEVAKKAVRIIEDKFGYKGNIYRYKKYGQCTVDFSNQILAEVIEKHFGFTHAHEKRIPSIVWHSSNSAKKSFLAAYFMSDTTYDQRIAIASASPGLLHDIQQLLLMLGMDAYTDEYHRLIVYEKSNIQEISRHTPLWHHQTLIEKYCHRDGECVNRKKWPTQQVRSIEKIEYSGYVYDLEVPGNRSFLVHGIWSHNCNTQGHLELRPPQYNRTPVSVFTAMLTYDKTVGIRLFPDFLEKLILGRTDGLIRDIKVSEWEIQKELAILGAGNSKSVAKAAKVELSQFLIFGSNKNKAANEQGTTDTEKQKEERKKAIQKLNYEAQRASAQQTGIFSADRQVQLQRDLSGDFREAAQGDISEIQIKFKRGKEEYDKAVRQISKLTGKPAEKFQDFESVRIGVPKNGVVSPASDISAAIGRLSRIVSKRSRLLSTLRRTLQQADEVVRINEGGGTALVSEGGFGTSKGLGINWNSDQKSTGLYKRLTADDSANLLGHMSGRRLVIDDEVIISSSFQEAAPNITTCEVVGTLPFVGDKLGGSSAGVPLFTALGVDFDLWRQYGWRGDKSFQRPFFWDAEQQCAPYAKMLLTRQRKNIVTGNVKVIGNEFYQLGDVVYVADRQMLYYTHRIRHTFTYGSEFRTTLELNYGHPPGEYIPTPLDVIGKNMSQRNDKHVAYRTRRFGPGMGPSQDTVLAAVKFPKKGSSIQTNLGDMLSHATGHGKRNFEVLVNALRIIKDAKNRAEKKENRPKIVVSYFGPSESDGGEMSSSVISWLKDPQEGGSSGSELQFSTSGETSWKKELSKLKLDTDEMLVFPEVVPYQYYPTKQLATTDLELLRQGVTASPAAYALDNTLETVVEVRLRRPPSSGWPSGESS